MSSTAVTSAAPVFREVPAPTKTYDKHAYQTVFPQYLDSTLTPKEGRRLTKTQSVEHPTVEEIAVALRELGYKPNIHFFIDRRPSLPCSQATDKFPVVPRGCVQVQIKSPADQHYIKKSEFDTQTREPSVPGIESKQALLRRVAEAIKAKNAPRPNIPSVEAIIAAVTPNQPKGKRA